MIILLVFVIFIGPKGLQQLLRGFRKVVGWGRSVSAKLREESSLDLSGTGLDSVDWSDLDLSQYDPRQIIRQAVQEEMNAWIEQAKGGGNQMSNPSATSNLPAVPKDSDSIQAQDNKAEVGDNSSSNSSISNTNSSDNSNKGSGTAGPQNGGEPEQDKETPQP